MNASPAATSAPFSEDGSSLDSDLVDSERPVSSEEFHELHGADVSLPTKEPGRFQQAEAAAGEHESAVIEEKAARLLKGKERERESVVQGVRPLQLLDLPVDILKEIIKEVSDASKDVQPPTLLTLTLGHSHQRSYVLGSHPLCPTQSCNTLHLLKVRYCLA